MNLRHLSYLFLSMLSFSACMPFQENGKTEVNIDLRDAEVQKIRTFQDQRQTDSLRTYLKSDNATYRYLAALAFASVQDTNSIDKLTPLLHDKNLSVREVAAFSLGQIGDSLAIPQLLSAFEQFDSTGQYNQFNANILEAVGKCGNWQQLRQLASIKTYTPQDTILLEGQSWGIYRFTLRGMTDSLATRQMVHYVESPAYPASVRFIAAHYLSRSKNIVLDSADTELVNAFVRETSPDIRMALAIAIGKTKSLAARVALLDAFDKEKDYRVKCNIIRALSNFEYKYIYTAIHAALKDPNQNIALTAAEFIRDNGPAEEAKVYGAWAKAESRWPVRSMLYEAANKRLPYYYAAAKVQYGKDLWQRFDATSNHYEKAAIVAALGGFGWNYAAIKDKTFASEVPVVRTAGVQALADILGSPVFMSTFQLSSRRVRNEINAFLREAILSKDAGMIAIAAETVAKPDLRFLDYWADSTFLETAQGGLQLPREIETYNSLQKAIDHLKKRSASAPKQIPYNNPIDWQRLADLNEKPRAIISTGKGNITVELYPKTAPGTVANFVRLAKENFYDGKFIHRVVPNFVIQGGGARGDGYGSLDYTIRSEISQAKYDAGGYIGMASAGKDTECTQWFITHSPTPHLDGKYTLFGKVVSGMDIVDQIEVGDRISKVVVH
jgi:cyclophilin family peptidyl-prolyl cis-trans isomerase/HEAT repeat protein